MTNLEILINSLKKNQQSVLNKLLKFESPYKNSYCVNWVKSLMSQVLSVTLMTSKYIQFSALLKKVSFQKIIASAESNFRDIIFDNSIQSFADWSHGKRVRDFQ